MTRPVTTDADLHPRPAPPACDPREIGSLFLFDKLTPEQLGWLCGRGSVEVFPPGFLYREGEPATCFYVLLDGTVVLSRQVGQDDVEVTRTDQRGVYSGAFQAYLGDRVPQVYNNSLRVVSTARYFVLPADDFAHVMREWFPMALHLLEGLFFGIRNTQEVVGQRERLLALGSLSAGLTHELNNPAAAAVRATAALRERLAGMRHKLAMLASGRLDRSVMESLIGLQEEAVAMVAKAPDLGPLEAADREDVLSDWFDDNGVRGGWELAPTFVQGGMDQAFFDRVSATVDPTGLEGAVRWLAYTVETEQLLDEIHDSTTRISTLVGAAKQYSQLDRAPYQTVDVHELLTSTLLMLSGKIKAVPGLTVVKDFDRTLPPIPAYAAELNQVWTNLIDNALAVMPTGGTLTLRTARDHEQLLVEIGDTGPGVPAEIRTRIFEPFFTTKPIGQGTGLGLDISFRVVTSKHGGDLRFESVPGDTRFQVRLPFRAPDRVLATADPVAAGSGATDPITTDPTPAAPRTEIPAGIPADSPTDAPTDHPDLEDR
ncbi:histidine kinase [Nakamurella flavida]|uniref:histidine kinase n=1 Tax=Nakamurella flavida TaxID=363630 RepID=A0A938YDI5_9ACTN|nr:ATP-binding protein [Nakamurella flavida]MBM9475686.1 histidine kinase [Nakamurella flavida]MDP9778037.1 signal transduction histidine kinase [Nakamurella flavida]